MTDAFSNPVFCAAVAEMESLGVKVARQPTPGAKPYAVVGGRSNARWWLIPLENARVAASGFALFQPLLASARIMKAAAMLLSRLGLSRLWARQKIYLTGQPSLARHFPRSDRLAFAYFTGTDSPHRKLAVQIMDWRGELKGFAKVTRNPRIRTLLMHEAATLERLSTLKLQRFYVPKLLAFGADGESTLLVTDTLKTPRTTSTNHFTAAHRDFIQEIAQKTSGSQPITIAAMAANLRERFDRLSPKLDEAWSERMAKAIALLEGHVDLRLTVCLNHGDFTPWNTFVVNGKLYVFDWEYAEDARPIGIDMIHFTLNEAKTRSQSVRAKIQTVTQALTRPWTGIKKEHAPPLMILYLLVQTIAKVERLPHSIQHAHFWDGADDASRMLEGLIEQIAASSA